MFVSLDYEEIFAGYLKRLLDFCYEYSDGISLTAYPEAQSVLDVDYISIKNSWEISFRAEDEKHRTDFKTNNSYREMMLKVFDTEDKVIEYFDELVQKHIEMVNDLDRNIEQAKAIQEIGIPNTNVEKDFSHFPLIKQVLTCETPCTSSFSEMTLYYFELDKQIKEELGHMEDLYSRVNIGEYLLDDPVFYRGEEIFLSICSHERYGTLYLNEKEYDQFKVLGIPHIIPDNMWWQKEYEEDDTYDSIPNAIIQERGLIGGIGGAVIELIDVKEVENNRSIFKEYKDQLDPYLIPVTEIIQKLKEKYVLEEFESEEKKLQIKANILSNTCLARHLPESITSARDMNPFLFRIRKEGNALSLYEKQKGEHKDTMKRMLQSYIEFVPTDFQEQDIIIGGEYNCGYIFADGSLAIREEITALRGLDEFELRKDILVPEYVKAAKKFGINLPYTK